MLKIIWVATTLVTPSICVAFEVGLTDMRSSNSLSSSCELCPPLVSILLQVASIIIADGTCVMTLQ